jgi:hypothetical protein
MPERFARLIVMNTIIAVGEGPGPGFDAWKAYANANPDLDVAGLMKRGSPVLDDAEAATYGAPFADARYKVGVRRLPRMVMDLPDMEGVDVSRCRHSHHSGPGCATTSGAALDRIRRDRSTGRSPRYLGLLGA